jgi:hypothetical protein
MEHRFGWRPKGERRRVAYGNGFGLPLAWRKICDVAARRRGSLVRDIVAVWKGARR